METPHPNTAEEVTAVCRQDRVAETIVVTLAETMGKDPLTMEPLYDVVDPNALDRLVESASGQLKIEFSMADCTVTVHGDGKIVVTPLETTQARDTQSATALGAD